MSPTPAAKRAEASLTRASATRKECEKMLEKARRAELRSMIRAVNAGVTQARCAAIMDVSHGRIYQILRDHTVEDEPTTTAAAAG